MAEIRLKTWDTEHFGIKIGEYILDTGGDVGEDVARAGGEAYSLLVARIAADRIEIVNALERNGFELKDTIVHYRVDLGEAEYFAPTSDFNVREATTDDLPAVREIAKGAFRDYIGHFHKDRRLDRQRCDELYERWAENSMKDKDLADTVLIAEENRSILGFFAIKLTANHESQGILSGTAIEAQGRGIYTAFIKEAINWSKRQNLRDLVLGSQVNNYRVQNVWMKVGARVFRSLHTFHCWPDSKV